MLKIWKSVCLYQPLWLSLCGRVCISVSVCLYLCLCVRVSMSVCLCVCVSMCGHVSMCPCVSVSVDLCVCVRACTLEDGGFLNFEHRPRWTSRCSSSVQKVNEKHCGSLNSQMLKTSHNFLSTVLNNNHREMCPLSTTFFNFCPIPTFLWKQSNIPTSGGKCPLSHKWVLFQKNNTGNF